MKFDLAFVLVDLGDPFYKQAASEMIRSARRAYKDHDMRVVQLSDRTSAPHPDADGVFGFDTDVDKNNLCQFKGGAIASYALQADRLVVFCDVDVIWNNDGLVPHVWNLNVPACLHRRDPACMPFNTGIIFSGNGRDQFWEAYLDACESLPAEVRGWWGDQFAITAASERGDIERLDMDEIAPAIDALPDKPLTTPAVHFKGNRKSMMFQYARMLDGGKGFDFVRPCLDVARPQENGLSLGPQVGTWSF